MRHDARVLLTDIDQAGADIERFTEDMDMDAYVTDSVMQSAVERKFEIIGEAVNRLHQNNPDLAERIPGMREIIDFRNLLAHGYEHVSSRRVWTYASSNLPQLRRIVQALLDDLKSPEE